MNGQRQATPARGAAIAGLFSLGLFTTIGVIGGVTAAAGRLMGDVGAWANYVVAAVFFVVGLSLLDVLPLDGASPDSTRFRGRGLLAAFAMGLIFGIALGPCTFAYMAPMLGVTFAVAGTHAALRRAAHCRLRHRPLFDHRLRRRVDELGGPLPSVDGRLARSDAPQVRVRAARSGGRGVPDLHGVSRCLGKAEGEVGVEGREQVRIEVLVFDGCPHAEAAMLLAQAVAERLGPGIRVERVEVDTPERAAQWVFSARPPFA